MNIRSGDDVCFTLENREVQLSPVLLTASAENGEVDISVPLAAEEIKYWREVDASSTCIDHICKALKVRALYRALRTCPDPTGATRATCFDPLGFTEPVSQR